MGERQTIYIVVVVLIVGVYVFIFSFLSNNYWFIVVFEFGCGLLFVCVSLCLFVCF